VPLIAVVPAKAAQQAVEDRRPHLVVTTTASFSPVVKYHGLARRRLTPPRFLMRPLLNGGTLGRLQRLGEFPFVRDRDRLAIDERLKLDRFGFTGRRDRRVFVRTDWDQTASTSSRLLASLRFPPLVSRGRRRHFHRPA
jgi:hypothetical protein